MRSSPFDSMPPELGLIVAGCSQTGAFVRATRPM